MTTGNLSNLVISNALKQHVLYFLCKRIELAWHVRSAYKNRGCDNIRESPELSVSKHRVPVFRVKEKLFFGFTEQRVDGKIVNIGEIEKVILDYLFIRRNAATLSLVVEKLREYQSKFDFAKMIEFAKTYNITVQRNLGFLLDTIGVSSDALYEIARSNRKGFSKMHPGAKTFNAKWRLYYDPGIIE